MNGQVKDEEMEIDLLELFHVLWRKIVVIVFCFILGVVLAGVGTKLLITPQYSATSTIYILSKTTSLTSMADIQLGAALTGDFKSLATTRTVVEEVIDQLNLDTTYGALVSTITVENPADTHFLKTTVKNPDPKLAMEISNAMSSVIADKVAEIMATDKPTTVEKAIEATSPVSPNVQKNALLGGVLLAFLSIAVILLRYFMDDTIKNEDDVEKYLGLNTLAAIPFEKIRSREQKRKRA